MRKLFVAGLLTVAAVTGAAHAQSYPERPVKVIVPFAPGGNVDVIARLANIALEKELKQTFVAENLAGASGAIGVIKVAKADPDGYTLLANSSIHVILPSVRSNLGYDAMKDFIPLSQLTEVPLVMLIGTEHPAKNHAEFLAWAKTQKTGVDYATFTGSSGHLAGELWKEQSGVAVNALPYKVGTTAIADVVAGRVPFMFDALFSATSMLQAGKMRAIAITGSARSPMLPDVPTFAELGYPGVDTSTWHGFWAPKGTPPAIVEKLGAALIKVSRSTEFADRVKAMGGRVIGSTPAEFARFSTNEQQRWAALLTRSGIKPE